MNKGYIGYNMNDFNVHIEVTDPDKAIEHPVQPSAEVNKLIVTSFLDIAFMVLTFIGPPNPEFKNYKLLFEKKEYFAP